MHCHFCQQWNADDASVCAYCGNDLRSPLDATVEGRPAYESSRVSRTAAVDRQAASIVHSHAPEPPVADNVVRGLVDLVGPGQRSVLFMIAALVLAFLAYKLSAC
jgi:hypothetical protein